MFVMRMRHTRRPYETPAGPEAFGGAVSANHGLAAGPLAHETVLGDVGHGRRPRKHKATPASNPAAAVPA